jgi:hypothetical protein
MACACLVQIWASDYSLSEKTLLMLFLGAGGYILFAFGHQCCKNMYDPLSGDNIRNDTVFLLVWVGAVTFCVLFVYSAASARYLLPLLPPFVLLAYRFPVAASSLKYRRWMWLSLAVSLTLALSLSISDFKMAKGHREIGLKLGQLFKGWESQVRFGGEWGFRHYLMENGFRQFTSTSDDMAGGQFVLSPRQAIPYRLPQDVESMLIPFDNLRWDSNFAIRLMNRQAHAGFYSSGWGLLPFVFSQIPIEEVTVQQVSYLVEKLPEITVESSSGDTAIPFPAPKGGIDLQIPLPSRLKIPYQGPWPAGVEFEWIPQKGVLGAGGIPESRLMETVSVAYECAGRRSNIALKLSTPHVPGHQTDSLKLRFDLPEWKAGLIILESRNPGLQELKNASHVLVRNWLIFPPWWPR